MKKPLRLLIVEDSKYDTMLLIDELQRGGYELLYERVETYETMDSALERQEWDLVIADYVMPHFSGLKALQLIKDRGLDVPFIIISGKIGEDMAVEAMKAGAHDYLLKDNLVRLSSAIDRELREAVVRRERRHAEQALKESEERYREIVETANEGIWVIDVENRTLFANRRLAEMLGCTVDDTIGQHISFITKKWRPIAELSEKCRKQGVREQIEHNFRRRNGSRIWVNINAASTFHESSCYRCTICMVTDITVSKQTEERLKYLSFHDVLTGLYNRSYFEEEFKRLNVERQLPLAIIIGDINGLKMINDTLGHQTGDKLLIKAARALKQACRDDDIICRWGGDEFAILFPKTDIITAEEICCRIRRACKETENELLPLGLALGAAAIESVEQASRDIFKEAEDIMYREKFQEKTSTRFMLSSPSSDIKPEAHSSLENPLI